MDLLNLFIKTTIFIGMTIMAISLISITAKFFREKAVPWNKMLLLLLPVFLFFILLVLKFKYIKFYFDNLIYVELYFLLASILFSVLLISFYRTERNAYLWAIQVFFQAIGTVGYFHIQNLFVFQNIHIGESEGNALLYMSIWGSIFSFAGFILTYIIVNFMIRRKNVIV